MINSVEKTEKPEDKKTKGLSLISLIAGAVFTFAFASLLHFFYEFSGGSMLSILFGSVNESTWEHIKLFIAPYFVWAIIELAYLRPSFKPFVVGKVVGLFSFPAVITILFYTYTAIAGSSYFIADILISVFAVFFAQWISYKVYELGDKAAKWFPIALVALVLLAVMYFSFTAVPPKAELFRDPITGGYGIPSSGYDRGAAVLENADLI